jgi:predicted transport protein
MEKGQLAQANRYIMWIRQHPDAFELLVRKNLKTEDEIDFSNPRIICFAQDYNIDDKCLALALGAELWKYQYYENNTLVIVRDEEPEQLIKTKPKSISVGKSSAITKEKKEIKTAKTVEEHLSSTTEDVKKILGEFDERLFDISSEIERYSTKASILYKTSVNFLELQVQKSRLRLLLRTKDNQMNDPKKLTEEIPKSYGWGNLNRVIFLDPKELNAKYSMDDVLELVMQAFKTTQ